MPYSLTSADSIRQMALQKRNLSRKKAEKEKAAKTRYLKKKKKEGKAKSSAKEPRKKQSSAIFVQKKLNECINVLI